VRALLALLLLPAALACRAAGGRAGPGAGPAATLDRLHAAASEADGAAYFALFAPDAVFLGTDATERWTVEQFRAYAEPFFARGQGWTYVPTERHVSVNGAGDVAWFDERLSNAKYGEVRGTGVLVRHGERWLVAQYNLAFPVPNALAPDLVERIRAQAGG
jgi:ketosteroid isomerase-like protein